MFNNAEDVAEWINDMDEEYNPSEEELAAAFKAVYGRSPEEGEDAFSLICAGV